VSLLCCLGKAGKQSRLRPGSEGSRARLRTRKDGYVENTNEAGLTVFGAAILELMASRGITGWNSLSSLMKSKGYDFKPPRISNWAYGRHAVSHEFTRAFATTLDLDEAEKVKLAKAFTFGQDEKLARISA
jgi:hypothetical protein